MSQYLEGKHIVLGISGGIAAYKAVLLLRLLIKHGAEVQIVITPNGKEFITPVTLSSLSGKPVISEFFTANTGEWHSHVDLGLWADLMVIAPATASTIGKMANGIADNMLITTYLSAKEHVMVAPAMDLDMWAHPSTQRNVKTLENDGVEIIYPAFGELASHLSGKGRMQEPDEIFDRIETFFKDSADDKLLTDTVDSPVLDKKIVITAGPTHENIDPVRFIGNYSSGKMGYSLASELSQRGARVTLISGPVVLESPDNVERINVSSAIEMQEQVRKYSKEADLVIFSAAVADYRPKECAKTKIKREKNDEMTLALVKNPDIAADFGKVKSSKQLSIGFALETEASIENAKQKLKNKNLDMIVLNSLSDKGAGFGTDTNKITIITDSEVSPFPLKSKHEAAKDIADKIESLLLTTN